MTEPEGDDPLVLALLTVNSVLTSTVESAREVRAHRAKAISDLRRPGPSRKTWAEIGALLGVSAQRAEQMSKPEQADPRPTRKELTP